LSKGVLRRTPLNPRSLRWSESSSASSPLPAASLARSQCVPVGLLRRGSLLRVPRRARMRRRLQSVMAGGL